MVVDDAVVVRRMLTEVLNGQPDVEVVAVASTGKQALEKLEMLKPDILTLDIEMPEMDGLQCLKEVRKKYPKLPVLMFSTLTERGAVSTLEALSLGANDYVTKPANVGSVGAAVQRIQEELVPKIRLLAGRSSAIPAAPASAAAPVRSSVTPMRMPEPARVDVVAIGVSTGGPNALAEMLPELPAELPVPIVIVQHMPPVFTKTFAERLDTKCKLRVREASHGSELLAGHIWIAPGDFHLTVARMGTSFQLHTNQGPHENSCRPAVDVLFRSVATVYGSNALGIVLTGMGQDGLRGSESMAAAGARILAQDEASSVVWGMPSFIAKSGFCDKVLPLKEIAREIVARVAFQRPAFASAVGLAK